MERFCHSERSEESHTISLARRPDPIIGDVSLAPAGSRDRGAN